MADEGARAGIPIVFLDAVDAKDLRARGEAPPSGLTLSEWACLQTHRAAWRLIVTSHEPAVVLEDDVDLNGDFKEILNELQRTIQSDDLVLLGHHSSRHRPHEGAEVSYWRQPLRAGYALGRVAEFPMGAYAALITPGAARRLNAFADPERMPADWVTGYSPRAGVRLMAVTPPCVTPSPIGDLSTIDDRVHGDHNDSPSGAPGPRRAFGVLFLWLRKLGIATPAYTRALKR